MVCVHVVCNCMCWTFTPASYVHTNTMSHTNTVNYMHNIIVAYIALELLSGEKLGFNH